MTAASNVKIRPVDMRIIDTVFGMEGGYVLDFSNRTFAEFFHEELNVDIYDVQLGGLRRERRWISPPPTNSGSPVSSGQHQTTSCTVLDRVPPSTVVAQPSVQRLARRTAHPSGCLKSLVIQEAHYA